MAGKGGAVPLLLAIRVIRSVGAGILYIVFPYIAMKELGLSIAQLGAIYAAAAVATALLSILVGYAADLMGRKASLYAASALMVASSALLMADVSVPSAIAAAVLGGISATGSMGAGGVGGAVAPVQTAIIADITSRGERTKYITWLSFAGSLASTGGLLLGGLLSYWEELAIATALGAGSMLLIPFLDLPAVKARGARLRREGASVAMKFSVTGMLNGLSNGLVTPFFIPLFIELYGIPRSAMGVYASISSVIAVFAMLLAPAIERTIGFVRGIAATRGATVALLAAFPFVRLFPVSLAIYLAYPALRVVAIPVQQSSMMAMVEPEERGRVAGLNQGFRLAFAAAGTGAAAAFMDPPFLWIPFIAYGAVMSINIALYDRFFGGWAGGD